MNSKITFHVLIFVCLMFICYPESLFSVCPDEVDYIEKVENSLPLTKGELFRIRQMRDYHSNKKIEPYLFKRLTNQARLTSEEKAHLKWIKSLIRNTDDSIYFVDSKFLNDKGNKELYTTMRTSCNRVRCRVVLRNDECYLFKLENTQTKNHSVLELVEYDNCEWLLEKCEYLETQLDPDRKYIVYNLYPLAKLNKVNSVEEYRKRIEAFSGDSYKSNAKSVRVRDYKLNVTNIGNYMIARMNGKDLRFNMVTGEVDSNFDFIQSLYEKEKFQDVLNEIRFQNFVTSSIIYSKSIINSHQDTLKSLFLNSHAAKESLGLSVGLKRRLEDILEHLQNEIIRTYKKHLNITGENYLFCVKRVESYDDFWIVFELPAQDRNHYIICRNKDIVARVKAYSHEQYKSRFFDVVKFGEKSLLPYSIETVHDDKITSRFCLLNLDEKENKKNLISEYEFDGHVIDVHDNKITLKTDESEAYKNYYFVENILKSEKMMKADSLFFSGKYNEAYQIYSEISRKNQFVFQLRNKIIGCEFNLKKWNKLVGNLIDTRYYGLKDSLDNNRYIIASALRKVKLLQPYILEEYTMKENREEGIVTDDDLSQYGNQFPDFIPEESQIDYRGPSILTTHRYRDYFYKFFTFEGKIFLYDANTENMIFERQIDKSVNYVYAKGNKFIISCYDSLYTFRDNNYGYAYNMSCSIYRMNLDDDYSIDTLITGIDGFYESYNYGIHLAGMKLVDIDEDGDSDLLISRCEWGEGGNSTFTDEVYIDMSGTWVKGRIPDPNRNYYSSNQLDVNMNGIDEYFGSELLGWECCDPIFIVRVKEQKENKVDTLYALLGDLHFHSIKDYDGDGIRDVLLQRSFKDHGLSEYYYILRNSDEDPEKYTERMIKYYFRQTMTKEYFDTELREYFERGVDLDRLNEI